MQCVKSDILKMASTHATSSSPAVHMLTYFTQWGIALLCLAALAAAANTVRTHASVAHACKQRCACMHARVRVWGA